MVLIKSALAVLLLKAQVHCPGYRFLQKQRGGLHSHQALTEMGTLAYTAVCSSHQPCLVSAMVLFALVHSWANRSLDVQ